MGSSIQKYVACNISEPLDITGTTFLLDERPNSHMRISKMFWRDPEVQSRLVKYALLQAAHNPKNPA